MEAMGIHPSPSDPRPGGGVVFSDSLPTIREVDALIQEALRRSRGKQNAAGEMIGLSPQAMSKRVRTRRGDAVPS